ncbi:hypothetical protein GCM10020000_24400 [Streptomyces olivoverticillatus]
MAALGEAFGALRLGRGLDDPDVGPLISARQRDRVLGHLREAAADCEVVTGGGVPEDAALAAGFFVQPTLLDGVSPKQPVFTEEVFGPVLCVTPFTGTDEAVALAEATSYRARRRHLDPGRGRGPPTGPRAEGGPGLRQQLQRRRQEWSCPSAATNAPESAWKKGFEALREYTRCKTVAIHAEVGGRGIGTP